MSSWPDYVESWKLWNGKRYKMNVSIHVDCHDQKRVEVVRMETLTEGTSHIRLCDLMHSVD